MDDLSQWRSQRADRGHSIRAWRSQAGRRHDRSFPPAASSVIRKYDYARMYIVAARSYQAKRRKNFFLI
jgi:hypothetical protein